MIAGSFGPYSAISARDHGKGLWREFRDWAGR